MTFSNAASMLPIQSADLTSLLEETTSNSRTRRRKLFLGGGGALVVWTTFLLLANYFSEIQPSSERHPLSFPRRKLNEDSVRFLTLGGPSTWGQGLEDPESQAYPYLLSNAVHNGAQRVGGPTLASLCTESIVGEETYDVIVLEFETEVASSLSLLAQRLQRRFPKAELVFVQVWSPSRYHAWDAANNRTMSIAQWKYRNETGDDDTGDFDSYDWVYDDNTDEKDALAVVVEEAQGKLYQLPPPTTLSQSIVEDMFLEIHRDEFFDLSYTLSPNGHQVVADGITSLLDPHQIILNRTDRNVVGDWGDGDSCQLWYDTGLGVPQFNSLIFSRFANNKKYALEVPTKGGSITVNNPFDQDRMVYLTYMTTTATGQSNKIYPRTKVQINDKNSVVLDPYSEEDSQSSNSNRHITRTSAIGNIPPGLTKIRLNPVESTAANFRLVGASLLSTEKAAHHIASEYAVSPDPAQVFEEADRDLDIYK